MIHRAKLNPDNTLTTNHITAGRIAGVEHTLCGLEVPREAEPCTGDDWCPICQELDG